MVREKKITIKHYLNKRVRKTILPTTKFAIYTQVTFNRKNVHLTIWDDKFTDKEFESFFIEKTNNEIKNNIEEKEIFIHRIIQFEYNLFQDEYNIKGLGNCLLYTSDAADE